MAWISPGGPSALVDSSLELYTGSRPLLEAVIRARTLALPNVVAAAHDGVQGLVVVDGAVRGVRVESGAVVDADLVIDATGRASRAPQWLREVGYDVPDETVVDANLGYASQIIAAPMDVFPGAGPATSRSLRRSSPAAGSPSRSRAIGSC